MKYALSFLTFILFAFFFSPLPASAQVINCQYGSTQARVQKDVRDPWKPEITIQQGETFNIGSFHDGTGQFANDTVLQVVGPGHIEFHQNGQAISVPQTGQYTLYVNTRNQFGGGCSEQAKVHVRAKVSPTPPVTPPTPIPTLCPYKNTQARVQADITRDWEKVIGIWKGSSFNVGSFHNETGQFASDTRIRVNGQGMAKDFSNAGKVTPTGTGWYSIKVTTRGYTGSACQETAWVYVW